VNSLYDSIGILNLLILEQELEDIINNKKPLDEDTLALLNLLIMVNKKISNGDNITKEQIKTTSKQLMSKTVSTARIDLSNSTLIGDKAVSGQIFISNSSSPNVAEEAIKNHLPIYNLTECEAVLKSYYHISGEILYLSSNLDGSISENDTNSYSISAYNAETREKLDLDICNNVTFHVQLPLNEAANLNMTLYKKMKSQGIDVFNKTDPAFTDFCFVNSYNGADTTVNWRRDNILQSNIPLCLGINCTYNGLNENNYIDCECTGLQSDNSVFNTAVNFIFDSISKLNIQVIYCYKVIPTVNKI
jgi:hypothetical protein